MRWRRLLIVPLVIATLVALLPLAYASPPDPSWVAGFWDDADYDDVVSLATSSCSIADAHPPTGLALVPVALTGVTNAPDGLISPRPLPSHRPRAPPAA